MSEPLWQPTLESVARSRMSAFASFAREQAGAPDTTGDAGINYPALHRWSIDEPAAFWRAVWLFCEVRGDGPGDVVLTDADDIRSARWFPEARLNFAENLMRRRDDTPALIYLDESGRRGELSHAELYRRVASLAEHLREFGIGPGDRVAAVLQNGPEAVIAMLATTSLGAIWSSCSPDFGTEGIVDRFGQIEPKVLLAVDRYAYGGKIFEPITRIREVLNGLPSVRDTIIVSSREPSAGLQDLPNTHRFDALVHSNPAAALRFERFGFDHPIAILYSSGTTGKPKCIVHGAGGTLLQHLKEHQLHTDLAPGDRIFYFTTCGWMMWNWLVSALASEATLILYDGSPFHPDGLRLFELIDREAVNVAGVSAKFIDAVAKDELRPGDSFPLEKLRAILSTGSPLAPESFDFVYRAIKADVQLSSISGGTDIVSCFVLGNPILPVHRGEIQCAGLGMAIDVYDDSGDPLLDVEGELVCTRPFPSMPVKFWNDPDGSRYRSAYFERFPGVWCHGDWIRRTDRGGFVITGRSDAVLNPGGVRIGTAEIYRQVERLDWVLESLAVGQDWEGDVRVVLFVRLRDDTLLDDAMRNEIRKIIRQHASPRHVPQRIVQVPDLPRTRSGKITELAVRDVIHGRAVKNASALANPEALAHFADREELAN
ncbi:MAG: acetoacetate--CoA ligase [Myxococcales bacterium]|nr:acetoacetate--CoA ligase [Myxococcales bacterium]